MLNAQPMGFYSASTLIQDAMRHGVKVLPIDLKQSAWKNTLEPHEHGYGVRIGLCQIKGIHEVDIRTLLTFDMRRPIGPLIRAADIRRDTWIRLAESGALDSFGLSRREALWQIRLATNYAGDSLEVLPPSLDESTTDAAASTTPTFRWTHEDRLTWDYTFCAHSTAGHPMELLRASLGTHIPTAKDLSKVKNDSMVSYVGLVICRQRPHTASGTCFFTLEDETGLVNLVLWKQVFERYAMIAKSASYIGARGKLQISSEGVMHLVAKQLWEPTDCLSLGRYSRDFH